MIQVMLLSGYFINGAELQKELGLVQCSEKEILTAGFKEKGCAFFAELNGLFSFVLYDEESETWYCCRDRFGGKGLYYAQDKDGQPVFSESIKELIKLRNEPAHFREDMLEVYLSYSYFPGEDTAFEGIWKPLPGYCYCFHNGSVNKERYFTPVYRTEERTEAEWQSILVAVLDEVFSNCLQGGASTLSSGIDSSYICRKLFVCDTYTAAYEESAFSEDGYAKELSMEIGAKHHAVKITPEEYLAMVPEIMRALEQPSSDASAEVVLTMFREIKKEWDFCYSGEGADELFLGYFMSDARNAGEGKSLYESGYIGTTAALSEADKRRILKHYIPSRKMEYVKEAYELSRKESPLSQAAMTDMLVWLNGNLLPGVYSLAKTVGLNILMPYFDNRLYDLVLKIPPELMNDAVQTKKIFREAVRNVVGDAQAIRRKRGFPVPLSSWMRRPDYIKRIKQTFLSDTAFRFFNTDELITFYNEMLSNPEDGFSWRKIWCIYCFIVWYDEMLNPYQSAPRWQVYDERFNRTESWSKAEFPDSKLRYMREAGCLVTALSTMLRMYGIVTESDEELFNPLIFLEEMKKIKGFTPAADLNLDALQDVYPMKYVGEEKFSFIRLEELMKKGEMCLVRVNGAHDAYHFVVPTGVTGDDVKIIDSGWNYEKLSSFTHVYSILRFVKISWDKGGGRALPPEEKIIRAAFSYIGVQESGADANDVIFNTHYYGRQVYGSEYPWCVAFEWDLFRECGLSSLFYDGGKTASCIELYRWAKETGRLVDCDKGKRGDIALYDWYGEGKPIHTGIILGDYCKGHYRTVEGNTTDPLNPKEVCGRVMVQKRRFGGIYAIIRPDYEKYE